MTDRPARPRPARDRSALDRLADEIVPALIARLEDSELGELEVRHDGWRVRLRRSPSVAAPVAPASGSSPAERPLSDGVRQGATSPAVGYFTPDDRAPLGRAVSAGDILGWVDVLGVRQEVVAPRDGIVGRYLAEAGQAVEYGQELVAVEGALRRAPGPAAPPSAGAGSVD